MLSILLLAALPCTQNPAPTLMVGDQAPELTVKQWLKGEPIERFERDKVYLVEFWATWCAPCVNGMKHLTELQKKYEADGLVVVGVLAEDKWGNDLPTINKLLAKQGAKVGYRIALDKPTEKGYENVFFGQTSWDFMGAAKGYFPISFLVDRNGRIAFIGLPGVAEGAIKEALAGTLDIEARAKAYAEYKMSERKLDDYYSLLKGGRESEAYLLGRTLVNGPFKFDARTQWLIGYAIVDVLEPRNSRDLELAEYCLTRALEASGGKDVNMRGAWACLLYQQGKREEGRKLMNAVIADCEHPADIDWMKKRLAIMEKGD